MACWQVFEVLASVVLKRKTEELKVAPVYFFGSLTLLT